jgi:hypothetical protein
MAAYCTPIDYLTFTVFPTIQSVNALSFIVQTTVFFFVLVEEISVVILSNLVVKHVVVLALEFLDFDSFGFLLFTSNRHSILLEHSSVSVVICLV